MHGESVSLHLIPAIFETSNSYTSGGLGSDIRTKVCSKSSWEKLYSLRGNDVRTDCMFNAVTEQWRDQATTCLCGLGFKSQRKPLLATSTVSTILVAETDLVAISLSRISLPSPVMWLM
jgi:hypothetical protein